MTAADAASSDLQLDVGLWVRSDVMPDGTYGVTISADADRSWALDRPAALRYAVAAAEAAQRAEYDAAVFQLLSRRLDAPPEVAAAVIAQDLRPDRPALDDEATAPLAFVPGVNHNGEGFITAHLDARPWGQLSPKALRLHAMTVLEAPAAADLDAGLLRALRNLGVPENSARGVVADIARWRTP